MGSSLGRMLGNKIDQRPLAQKPIGRASTDSGIGQPPAYGGPMDAVYRALATGNQSALQNPGSAATNSAINSAFGSRGASDYYQAHQAELNRQGPAYQPGGIFGPKPGAAPATPGAPPAPPNPAVLPPARAPMDGINAPPAGNIAAPSTPFPVGGRPDSGIMPPPGGNGAQIDAIGGGSMQGYQGGQSALAALFSQLGGQTGQPLQQQMQQGAPAENMLGQGQGGPMDNFRGNDTQPAVMPGSYSPTGDQLAWAGGSPNFNERTGYQGGQPPMPSMAPQSAVNQAPNNILGGGSGGTNRIAQTMQRMRLM